MAKVTILFGLLLIVLGVIGYVGTGWKAPTALIPTYLGIVFAILGFLARRGTQKRRMLMMHIAVTLGALGFLVTAKIDLGFHPDGARACVCAADCGRG